MLCVRRLIRHHVADVLRDLHVLILAVVAEVITVSAKILNANCDKFAQNLSINIRGHYARVHDFTLLTKFKDMVIQILL